MMNALWESGVQHYQESRAEEEFVVDAVSGFHFGELIPQRAHDGQASCVCMPEEGVDVGQQNVSCANGLPDAPGGILQRKHCNRWTYSIQT